MEPMATDCMSRYSNEIMATDQSGGIKGNIPCNESLSWVFTAFLQWFGVDLLRFTVMTAISTRPRQPIVLTAIVPIAKTLEDGTSKDGSSVDMSLS
jgi:hypothetical protein